jgi:hypothetical protein
MHGLAVVEEDAGLGFAHDHLRAVLDFAGAILWESPREFLTAVVKPLDELKKEKIVDAHLSSSVSQEFIV